MLGEPRKLRARLAYTPQNAAKQENRMAAYSDSARHRRWVVILDLNGDGMCAPEVLPRRPPTNSNC